MSKVFLGKEGLKLEGKRRNSRKRVKALKDLEERDVPIHDIRVASDAANTSGALMTARTSLDAIDLDAPDAEAQILAVEFTMPEEPT